MPTKRKYKKKRAVRKYKRKKRASVPYMAVQRSLICAPKQMVKFKYRTQIQLDASAVAVAIHNFAANGLYDPDITGVGHQPLGFDEWMKFYLHYTVVGAKCTATFIPIDSSTTLTPQWCGIQVSGSAAVASSNPDTFLEQKYTRKKLLTLPTAKGYTTVSQQVGIKKFLGVKDLIDEDNNSGNTGANPLEVVYFHVFTGPYSAFYNPSIVNISVELEFTAVLHEPKQLTTS